MTGAPRPSPPSSLLPWIPWGLGVVVLLIGAVVAALLGAWEVVMKLCIECPRRETNLVPAITLSVSALLATSGGGTSLWLTRCEERGGRRVSGLLIPAGIVLVVAAITAWLSAAGWLIYLLR